MREMVVNGGGLSDVIVGLVILGAYIFTLAALAVYCYEKRVTP
jgi:hypothetical protein